MAVLRKVVAPILIASVTSLVAPFPSYAAPTAAPVWVELDKGTDDPTNAPLPPGFEDSIPDQGKRISPESWRQTWAAYAAMYLLIIQVRLMQAQDAFFNWISRLANNSAAWAVQSAQRGLSNYLEEVMERGGTPSGQVVYDASRRYLVERGNPESVAAPAANALKEIFHNYYCRFFGC